MGRKTNVLIYKERGGVMRVIKFRGKASNFNKIVYRDLVTIQDTFRIREKAFLFDVTIV